MRRRLLRGRAAVAVLAVAVCGGVLARPAGGDDFRRPDDRSFDEVVAALKKWEGFWTSIRLSFKVRMIPDPREKNPQRIEETVDWLFALRQNERVHHVVFADGAVRQRMVLFNALGRRVMLRYPNGQSLLDSPSEATIHLDRVLMPEQVPDGPLIELRNAAGEWFSESLYRHDATVPGEEDLADMQGFDEERDGSPACPQWELSDRTAPFYRRARVVSFDPAHGFLPRLIATRRSVARVTQFREVAPGIWFPWKGETSLRRRGSVTGMRWEVTSFEFNKPVEDSEFDPRIPVGTPVIDWDGTKYRQGIPEPEPPAPPTFSEKLLGQLYRARFLFVVLLGVPLVALAARWARS